MSKFLGALLAISTLLGCDAVVGTEPCTGTSCEDPPAATRGCHAAGSVA